MGYADARKSLNEYRRDKIAAVLGKSVGAWFADRWGDIASMLKVFSSDKENQEIAAGYASLPSKARAAPNLRLDYVCALRREVRKQYVSGEDGIYTDVTPFRHSAVSTQGARMFDSLMDAVIQYSEQQAKGSVA